MIYLDSAATTNMSEEAVGVYQKYACQSFFNPSAGYGQAVEMKGLLDKARQSFLKLLHASRGSVIFTSGATESNNLAIMGSRRNGKWEYVFSEGEHPSVYNVAKELENQGHIVHFIKLQKDGQIDYEKLENVLNEKTRLISAMHVSNETGAINDLKRIDALRKKYCPKALFHVDGVQAFCKIEVNVSEIGADFYTISAHKFHGPKGVGALYVKELAGLKNIVYGGGQENGYRSGTENVSGIMAMLSAAENVNVQANLEQVERLNKTACEILSSDQKVEILNVGSPYILSLSFSGVNGETLMRALSDKEILVGKGSACSTKKAGNRILESMGQSMERIKSNIRLSFDVSLKTEDVEQACKTMLKVYNEIWEKVK